MFPRHFLAPLVLVSGLSAAPQERLLDAPLVIAGSDSRLVTTLDLDGDGWEDAIGWWQNSAVGAAVRTAKLSGWINDGTGRLVRSWDRTVPLHDDAIEPHDGCATGDLDGDGDLDFVVSNAADIRVYLSNGADVPTTPIVHATAEPARGIALADFDLDGDLDLAANLSGRLVIFAIGLSPGSLTEISDWTTGADHDGRLVAAELTGDAYPDLLVAGSRIYPVLAGALQVPSLHALGWPSDSASLRHDVGDVDGDGDLDVVTFRVPASGGAAYRVLRRTAPDAFVAELPLAGGPARRLFDVDADGDLDGVCCGGSGQTFPQNAGASHFRIAKNDGSGSFAPSIDVPSVGSTAIAGVVDLDHDGDVDLVAGRCVYYARGPITGSPFAPVGTRVQNEHTMHDVDVEGDPDVELTIDGVRINLGDGTEVAKGHVLPPPPRGYPRLGKGAVGDWDGDGDPDLLVTLGTANAPLGLELLRNVGCGVFESAGIVAGPAGLTVTYGTSEFGFPSESEDSLAADVDGDLDLDLVKRTFSQFAPGGSGFGSSWFRNEGAQGFLLAGEFDHHVVVHVGDLNGDATPDLFAIPFLSSSPQPLRFAPGFGRGSFGPFADVPGTKVRTFPPFNGLAVADVDLDGDADIVHAYTLGTTGSEGKVLLNNGAGHFSGVDGLHPDLDSDHWKRSAAAVTDLDQDGLPDLLFGASMDAPNAIVIYLRRPLNDGWETPIQQPIFSALPGGGGKWNTVLTPRDPDGDRDNDLITNQRVTNLLYDAPDAGSRVQLQDGRAGLGAIVPTLGGVGPFRLGKTVKLKLRGARPAASAWISAGFVDPSVPVFGGGLLHAHAFPLEPLAVGGVASDPAGSGSWSTTFVVPASFVGKTRSYVVLVEDEAAPGGVAVSNTLRLSFGP